MLARCARLAMGAMRTMAYRRQRRASWWIRGAVLASLGLLGACSTPIVKETDATAPKKYISWIPDLFKTKATPGLPKLKEQWWHDFQDEELNRLVDQALTNNFDLRIAIARVAQSRAQVDVVRSTLYPTVDVVTGYTLQAPSSGVGSPQNMSQWNSSSSYQVGVQVNYEVDIWGKKGFNTDSAMAQAMASEYNREAIALSLVGDVITNYFLYQSLSEQIAVGERNLAEIRKISRGIERRVELGDSTLIDLSQQLVMQQNTEGVVVSQRLQRENAFNRLATLLGVTPTLLQVKGRAVEAIRPALVAVGMPSDLLCRRPDIRRAEAMFRGSQADLYAARANILPSFILSGGGGYGSTALTALTAPQSLFYNFTANLIGRAFDGGRRDAEERVADAKNVEMLENYAGTVIAALRDVESALAAVELSKQSYTVLNQARLQAQRLSKMSDRVVEMGGMDYVQLYEIQRIVFTAENAAVNARFEQLRSSVDLFKALGGGMKLDKDPCLGGGKLPPPTTQWVEQTKALEEKNRVTKELMARQAPTLIPASTPAVPSLNAGQSTP